MASARYTLNITPDAPETAHVMTKKEKYENFWFYHKWHVLAAVVLLLLGAIFVHDIVSKVNPDYQLAVISDYAFTEEVRVSLETELSRFADDRNGDGKALVQVVMYELPVSEEAEAKTDPNVLMANVTRLMSDAQTGESLLFLTNHADVYQQNYAMFAYNNGASPAETDVPNGIDFGAKWTSCPVLTGFALADVTLPDGTIFASGQTVLQEYELFLRVWDGTALQDNAKRQAEYEGAVQLFRALTEGRTGA